MWGVPIPVFYAEDGTAILDDAIINHVADLFEKHGSNIWFDSDASELLPKGYTHPGSPNGKFTKETDIMDVWFDSGTSHVAALKARYGVGQADVYLEGSDQYRGWFNSSLSTSVALNGEAPYKTVISHGFTLDAEGRKMSKSLGNTIDPLNVCKEFGADILRLWVASVDYQADMRISKDILKQISDSYRKIRNTYRFLLGNVFDFDPEKDMVDYNDLGEIDKYILIRLNEVIEDAFAAYDEYAFADVYRTVLNFMSNELSSFYLDFTKDVLYIDEKDSLARRSIQTVFYEVLKSLVLVMNPIIPHTAEEVYSYMPGIKKESVYLEAMPVAKHYENEKEILAKYSQFMALRDDVLKALEIARNEKIIGKSLNAKVLINPAPRVAKLLIALKIDFAQVFIVSSFEVVASKLNGDTYDSGVIEIQPAEGVTCSRCWQVVPEVDEDGLCPRCRKIVDKLNNNK